MTIDLAQPLMRCTVCGEASPAICARNCKENLRLTGRRYTYGQCRRCRVISQMPVPSTEFLTMYYQQIDQNQQQRWRTPEG